MFKKRTLTALAATIMLGSLGAWNRKSGAQSEQGIDYSPTAENELPLAIVGKAPPPRGRHIQYYPGHPKTRGYLALPAGKGPHGAVILIHEWNGLVDRVRQVADGLAAEGYVALAADLYSGRVGSSRQENRALVRETLAQPGEVIANLNAAARFLRDRPDVSGKIGAVGWCFGGGVALSYALGGKNHDATAIFYGRLLDDPEKMGRIQHEVYGTFAGLDRGISPEQVGQFVAALRKAGVPNDVHVYDDVNHGFWLWVDRAPEKRSKPALDAWKRLKAYFKRTLAG
ncbi:MAG: dienelactone hydrolase family protein [Acidobacteriota bacterium]